MTTPPVAFDEDVTVTSGFTSGSERRRQLGERAARHQSKAARLASATAIRASRRCQGQRGHDRVAGADLIGKQALNDDRARVVRL